MDADLALLHQKLDYLTEQMEAQQRRQRELEELKQDLIPIVNHMFKLSIEELAEIGSDFELEDLLFLLKRALRNTRTLLKLMDYLEGAMGLAEETSRMGKEIFNTAVEELDRLERQGYFAFLREAWRILERIVSEFSEEDVRALGDNIVTILTTVRNMTQPEVLAMANKAIEAIRPVEEPAKPPSTLALMREFSDPKVRMGMARMLNLVKALAEQPAGEQKSDNANPI